MDCARGESQSVRVHIQSLLEVTQVGLIERLAGRRGIRNPDMMYSPYCTGEYVYCIDKAVSAAAIFPCVPGALGLRGVRTLHQSVVVD